MYDIICGNLDRQVNGLALLRQLLDEEFSLLMNRQTDAVMSLEFSIHELVRQLANEKVSIQHRLGGGKVRDYAAMLEEDQQQTLCALWQKIDELEQYCSQQASLNAELSLAFLDQSKAMLSFLHEQVKPHDSNIYTRTGGYMHTRPEATFITGRM